MFDIFKFVFRNEGSAASVRVTEKEDSRVAVSPNKSSSSSPAVSPKKRPKLSQTLSSSSASESDRDKDKRQTEASSSSSKSSVTVTGAKTKSKNRLIKLTLTAQQLADVEHESEGAESTQRIIEDLNSRLRSSPDMFDNENENEDIFKTCNLNPRVNVGTKVRLDQHYHMDSPGSHENPIFTVAQEKNPLIPLTLPPLSSLPVTERVTTSKSGGGAGGGAQQETGDSPSSPTHPSPPGDTIMVSPPPLSSHHSDSSESSPEGSGSDRGDRVRPSISSAAGIEALLKKKGRLRKKVRRISVSSHSSERMPINRNPETDPPAAPVAPPPKSPTGTGSNETTSHLQQPKKPVKSKTSSDRGRHTVSVGTTERRINMTKEELATKFKHIKKYFVIHSVEHKTTKAGKLTGLHIFQCVLCRPKITKLKCNFDTRANLKRHLQAKHKKHFEGYLIADSVKKIKESLEEKEDADDPENQPIAMSIQKSSIYIQKKRSDAIVDFFVANFISLRVVESPSFNKMMMANNSTYKPISRRTLMRLIGDRHHFINENLRR